MPHCLILPLAGLRDYPVGVKIIRIVQTFTLAIIFIFICAWYLRMFWYLCTDCWEDKHHSRTILTKEWKESQAIEHTAQSPLLTEEPSRLLFDQQKSEIYIIIHWLFRIYLWKIALLRSLYYTTGNQFWGYLTIGYLEKDSNELSYREVRETQVSHILYDT